MKLQDGQVMDYTKDTVPYMDHRFTGELVIPQQAPESTDASTQSHIIVPSVTPNSVPQNPWQPQPQQITQPFIAPMVPQVPYAPVYPSFDPALHVAKDVSSEVYGKVLARKEALESLDDQTPEMKATIKTLDWVLETITKTRTWCNSVGTSEG